MKWSLSLVFALAQLGVAQSARAEDVGVEHLRIDLDAKASRKPPKAKKAKDKYFKDWKKACDQLGKALTVEKGPWGFGTFGTFTCYRYGKLVAGQEKPSKWSLTVADGAKGATFTIAHQSAAGKTPVAETQMPPSDHTLEFFQDDEMTDMIAYNLMKEMPFGMLVTKARIKGNPPTFSGRYWRAGKAKDFKYKNVPEAPEYLTLYRLSWDEPTKSWKSKVVGSAKRTKVTPPKKTKKKKATTLSGGEVVYETTPAVSDALASGPLWAQDGKGPGEGEKVLEGNLKDAQIAIDAAAQNGKLADFLKGNTNLLSSLLDTAASGYVGLRYGKEVLPGEGELGKLLGQTSMFGLLVEIRGGPLKGLRYYYDKLPKTKATLAGTNGDIDASIEFSRHVIGFSWDFNPGFLVDRVTIDPKMGMWTFNATLPTSLDENGKISRSDDFNLGRTFSLALEVGAEEFSDWYTVREWYAINTGYSLLKSGGKITSNRFGVDAYFTAGPVIPMFGVPFKTALLAFYVFEHVNITSGSKEDPKPGEDSISGITYDAGYAGGGVAISW